MSDEFTYSLHLHFTPLTCTPFHFQIGVRFARQQDPLPYLVSQPLPWQVHSVSHSRRSSKTDEVSCNEICTSVKQTDSLELIQHIFIFYITESSTKTTSSPMVIDKLYEKYGVPFSTGTLMVKVPFSAIWTSPDSVAGIFMHKSDS